MTEKENEYQIYSKKITDIAKTIFGEDIIHNVYVQHYDKYKIGSIKNLIEEESNNEKIMYHGQDIVIQFTNGKIVEFTNSEWASIRSLSLDKLKII